MANFFQKLFGPPVADITVDEAQKRSRIKSSSRPYLLDVRRPGEYKSGHAPSAKLIPLHELRQRMSELPENREIMVICATGRRSKKATKQLLRAGYNAVNVSGGMMAWGRAKHPVRTKK